MPSFANVKADILALVRRGPRTVLWTYPEYGFGNVLYGWMHAHRAQRRGDDTVALLTHSGRQWLAHLGGRADRLVCHRDDVGISDRRELGDFFAFGSDFDSTDLDAFINEVLLGAPLTAPVPDLCLAPEDVVVTIRRGDYWSVPRFRARYAFDTRAYLAAALERQLRLGGPIPRAHVISDDVGWCRENLRWLADFVDSTTFADPGHTPRDHFATMAAARRLVLTNTTFGYWGAYTAGARYGHERVAVVAPRFHARGLPSGTDAVHIDPRWSMIETIPGGWVEPPPDPVAGD